MRLPMRCMCRMEENTCLPFSDEGIVTFSPTRPYLNSDGDGEGEGEGEGESARARARARARHGRVPGGNTAQRARCYLLPVENHASAASRNKPDDGGSGSGAAAALARGDDE